jgi:hypothetical protein
MIVLQHAAKAALGKGRSLKWKLAALEKKCGRKEQGEMWDVSGTNRSGWSDAGAGKRRPRRSI